MGEFSVTVARVVVIQYATAIQGLSQSNTCPSVILPTDAPISATTGDPRRNCIALLFAHSSAIDFLKQTVHIPRVMAFMNVFNILKYRATRRAGGPPSKYICNSTSGIYLCTKSCHVDRRPFSQHLQLPHKFLHASHNLRMLRAHCLCLLCNTLDGRIELPHTQPCGLETVLEICQFVLELRDPLEGTRRAAPISVQAPGAFLRRIVRIPVACPPLQPTGKTWF